MGIRAAIQKRLPGGFTLNIEFESQSERCLGILGASGSGKSMTLKCVAGIETPDSGIIEIDGITVFDSSRRINVKPQRRETGYLFQNYALFPTMTVLENIRAPLKDGRKAAEQAARLIARFGLEGLESRLPKTLSGGQQQRAALARMLIRKPRAVLLDEPFSALDENLREYMQLELAALLDARSEGGVKNAVLVTHSRDEVFRLCPDLLMLESGRVIAAGKTREIFDNPKTLAAARLSGCKNISRVSVLSDYELYALDWGIKLRTEHKLDGVTHAGIRAHSFENGSAARHNTMKIKIKRKAENPFEHTVIFTNAEAKAEGERGELWWKYPASKTGPLPDSLFFPAKHILPLSSN
ncbi:MAG: ATP-binding cassette domain-containing protein [Spirochaetaceae bacterium]|nr:ATP-binding cassette domain-containing protein [Spirochaetaceae bacterium]